MDHRAPLLAATPGERGKESECELHASCFLSEGDAQTTEEKKSVQRKLLIACILCFIFMLIEVAGGYFASSVAIMADAAHMLSDVSGFAVSLFAAWSASQRSSVAYTFGYHRAEIVGALVSVLIIWAVTGALLYEAVQRTLDPTPVDGRLMFIVAVLGIFFNLFTYCVLGHGHSHGGHSHGGHSHGDDHGHGHCEDDHDHGAEHNGSAAHGHAANPSPQAYTRLPEAAPAPKSPAGHKHDAPKEHAHAHGDHNHGHAGGDGGGSSTDPSHDHHGHGTEEHGGHEEVGHAHGPGCRHGHNHGSSGEGDEDSNTLPISRKPGSGYVSLPVGGINSSNKGRSSTHNHSHHGDVEAPHGAHEGHTHGGPEGAHGGGHSENINLRSALLHVLGDLLQSVGVAVAGALIWWKQDDTRWALADPICTYVFSVLVLLTTREVLVDLFHTLMERSPEGLDVGNMSDEMHEIPGVHDVHDLHIWNLSVGLPICTAHVHLSEGADPVQVLSQLERYLRRHNIRHSTIQVCNPQGQVVAASPPELALALAGLEDQV